MSAKALMPNQCMPLHFIYGPADCCLCHAKAEVDVTAMLEYQRIVDEIRKLPTFVAINAVLAAIAPKKRGNDAN